MQKNPSEKRYDTDKHGNTIEIVSLEDLKGQAGMSAEAIEDAVDRILRGGG